MSVSDYVSTVADEEVEETERVAKMKEFKEQPTVFAQELCNLYLSKGTFANLIHNLLNLVPQASLRKMLNLWSKY
jgi:hypothetical protein